MNTQATQKQFTHIAPAGKQRGAVLVIGLVFLLLLTIIGISSMSSTILELKMATNMQQQSLAFGSAEQTLIKAQQDVKAIIANPAPFVFSTAGDAYYDVPNGDIVDFTQMSWSGVPNSKTITNSPSTTDKYVVEFLGDKPIPGGTATYNPNGTISGENAYTFRLTAHSDAAKGTVRVLQSIYVSDTAP